MAEKENRQPIKALRGDGGLVSYLKAKELDPNFFEKQPEGAAWTATLFFQDGSTQRLPPDVGWAIVSELYG